MKEITILSGKGGTGKTSITAGLASVAKNALFTDNDVDAADLHLIFNPEIKETHIFHGAYVASIDQERCIQCSLCIEKCRFEAISKDEEGRHLVDPFKCEGCRLCERICPQFAIKSERSQNNFWYVSDSRFGTFVHARMGAGEENSGKLVSRIRKKAKEIALEQNKSYIINDGPPGVGCAAISSVTGSDLVLLVIEPSNSGIHDAKRLLTLVESFRIPAVAVINKCDIHPENSSLIEEYLHKRGVDIHGRIPFDKDIIHAMTEGKTILEYNPRSEVSETLRKLWMRLS